MLVQRDAKPHRLAQQRPQPVEIVANEQRERRHLERLCAARLFDGRQRQFGEMDVAGRAPRHHLPGLARRHLVERAFGDAAEGGGVAGAHWLHAAAMGRAAHHLVADAERIHDVEREQRDVRRLEHVAAGVEDEIRRRVRGGPLCALPEPRQQLVVELQPRNLLHVASPLCGSLRRRSCAAPRRRLGRAPCATRAMRNKKRGLTP